MPEKFKKKDIPRAHQSIDVSLLVKFSSTCHESLTKIYVNSNYSRKIGEKILATRIPANHSAEEKTGDGGHKPA